MPTSISATRADSFLPPSVGQSKSILRRQGDNVKRKLDMLDMEEGTQEPQTPAKRRKVLFSDSSPIVHEILADVRAEVRRTLDRHRQGQDEEYQTLKQHFSLDTRRASDHLGTEDDDEPPIRPHELTQYVLALASCAPTLKERPFRDLVQAVLKCAWVGRDDRFVHAYIEFLAALASIGSYLSEALGLIFDYFSETRKSRWTVPGYPEVSKRTHVTYVRHLLRIRQYAPDAGTSLLNLIVEQLVHIDVSMQADLDDFDDDLVTAVHRALAEAKAKALQDEDSADESDESDDDDDDEEHEQLQRIKTVKNHIEILDAVMDILFKFHDPYFANPTSETATTQCGILLSQFTNILLQMRKSRHTQFLLFHFTQKSDALASQFIDTCEKVAFRSAPSVLGDYAVSYLASFLARGAHIPSFLIQAVFRRLLQTLDRRRATYEQACQGPNIEKYYSYYSLFQAILYIFCFRWKDLVVSAPETVDGDDPLSYIGQDLDWGQHTRRILKNNAHSKLNPLKVCSPGIVEEFAKLAHKLNLVYVYPILEINKRVRLSQYIKSSYSTGGRLRDIGNESARDDHSLQLDSFFPFDPYQLPSSKLWLEGDYLPWSPIRGLNEDEDDGYDSDDEDDDLESVDADLIDDETATSGEEDEDED
ncbi:unnamed protein product [Parascedosporium putredinis]|uniref:RNA polymerase I-specific transcription initiation factor RRN3 n=1 Tax=Parascedosporium putredinis TaxID=1442378 RepID=A0A9P1MBN4_9PEZI|nr:unnamed protein product [Parascedosporium putredinis]CAI7999006.1 unnamed protein product [Parascedosporium putredinis]